VLVPEFGERWSDHSPGTFEANRGRQGGEGLEQVHGEIFTVDHDVERILECSDQFEEEERV
jgi:hypothetical protein